MTADQERKALTSWCAFEEINMALPMTWDHWCNWLEFKAILEDLISEGKSHWALE